MNLANVRPRLKAARGLAKVPAISHRFHFDKRVRHNAAKDTTASTTLADAVVDAVILLAYVPVERRLTRRLRNAGPCDSLASRRQIVLIEKLARRRLAEFRGYVTGVALSIGGHRR